MKRVALVLFAGLLSTAASCPHPSPGPVPNPTPPAPTPPPTPPPTPTKDTLLFPEILLRQPQPPRIVRGGHEFHPQGMTQCCMATVIGAGRMRKSRMHQAMRLSGVEVNSRWPSISVEVQDYFHKYGANYFTSRISPYRGDADHESEWAGIGGPYNADGSFNQPWWDEEWRLIYHSGTIGANHEVVDDSWWWKFAKQNGADELIGVSAAEVAAYGKTLTPQHRAFIDKQVLEFGCMANVSWRVDIEGALIPGWQRSFYVDVAKAYRASEQAHPCKAPGQPPVVVVHLIGTNVPEIGDDPAFDYVTTHADAALTTPFYGKHTGNDEHNKHIPPDEDHARYCTADAAGLHWWLWRASWTDDELTHALNLRKEGCGAPVGCFAPDSEDPLWSPGSGAGDQAAMEAVKVAEGAIGDRCGHVGPLPDDPSNAHGAQEESLALLAADLRESGYCASGPWGDALAILQSNGLWAEVHAIEFGGGCWTTGPQNYPKNLWKYGGTNPSPPPTDACPINPPPVTRVDCKMAQPYGLIDCTPKANGQPILPEGDPNRAACELKASGGPPTYSLRTDSGALSLQLTDNPWQVVAQGKGTGFLTCHVPVSAQTMCNLSISK